MRRTWPFLIAVGALGGLAGAAIAGRPHPADTFIIDPVQVPASSTLVTTVNVTTTAVAATGTVLP